MIQIKLNIENESTRPVLKAHAEILRFGKYRAEHKGTTHLRNSRKSLAKTSEKIKIEPKTKGEAIISIEVPDCIPSFNSSFIDVFYNVWVSIDVDSTFGGKLETNFFLRIGTVPIRDSTRKV
uniref:Arrestin_C domain-containing protein n=1 Tax=Caenorhabditis tropicalis TaxID=1561998 RepID=A0A1I7T7U9_9PELO